MVEISKKAWGLCRIMLLLSSRSTRVTQISSSSITRITFFFLFSYRFHGTSVVDFDSARGGISLETEKTESGTSSRLMLTRAALRDSGNYTCVPAGAVSASVQVHVLNGKFFLCTFFVIYR